MQQAVAADENGLPIPRRYFATAAILAGIVLAVLDGAIANVALPTIARTFEVSPAASIWVVTAYQMALIMALLPCAALGESLGYRRVFTAGVALFTTGSACCALSPALPWLIGARFFQGLGAAAVMALVIALLRFTYPHRMLGAAIGVNALVVALTSAAGPAIGAAVLSIASWPWLFAINIPVGIGVLVASRVLPPTPGSARPFDLISVALNAGVFGPLIVGADLLTNRPGAGAALLAMALLCLVMLIRREMPLKLPLIPLDLMRRAAFRISVMASFCCFAAQMAGNVALPFYLQHSLGQNAFMTGLYMVPWPLAVAVAAPTAGHLSERLPTAWLCIAGGICLAIGLTLAALWPFQNNLLPLVLFTIMSGLGFGFFQTPNNRNMLLSVPRERSGAAGGMQGMARQIGQTAGAIIMVVIFNLLPLDFAPRVGLGIAAALALAGALISALRIGQ